MSNVPGMVYCMSIDQEWTCQLVSEGAYDLTGYQPEDLINNRRVSYRQVIHPEDRNLVQLERQAAIANRRPFQIVYRILTATEELKWVWEQGRGTFDSNGEIVAIEGFVLDITVRKRAEQKVELLLAISQAISSAPDFLSALEVALRLVCETTG